MNESRKANGLSPPKIKEKMVITNPEAVSIIFHEKKGEILKHLIYREMTLIDLKYATGLNPGTVKRHLKDLLEHELIFISRERINEFSIVMKYYRASAKSFIFNIKWPK